MDALRKWTNDDGTEYTVITGMGIISEGFFASQDPRIVIDFHAPAGEVLRTAYSTSTPLHRQPDYELRAYLNLAKHNLPVRSLP